MLLLFASTLTFVPAALLAALFAWARWLRRRTAAHRFFVWAAYTALAALALLLFSSVGWVGYVFFSGASEGASKARALAEAVSEAMNCGGLTMLASSGVAAWLLAGTSRWRWSVKPVEAERQPPYR